MESSGWKGGETVEKEKNLEAAKSSENSKVKHVGGVSDDLGGVDPDIDETLERLSGGP